MMIQGPNDEPASEIQDLAHHMYLITLDNKLHVAPLKEIHVSYSCPPSHSLSSPAFQNVLDVGTGTGIWAMDFADTYPSASVLGVDLSPTQPSWVPINCAFEVDDLTAEWTWPNGHFDFIHVREMFGSIPDWDSFFEQCYRCTSSGGWVEVVEHAVEPIADDDTMPPEHFYWKWGDTVVSLGNKIGKSFTIYKEAKERLERAGFVDVVEVKYKWPMNAWPDDAKGREIGRWNQLRLFDGVEGFMLRLLTGPGEVCFNHICLTCRIELMGVDVF
jgi:SAM-dependent methyltransferase